MVFWRDYAPSRQIDVRRGLMIRRLPSMQNCIDTGAAAVLQQTEVRCLRISEKSYNTQAP